MTNGDDEVQVKPLLPLTGIAANVRIELTRYDVPQTQIAELLGLTSAAMSRRLRGQTPFRDHELARIAEYLGISIAVLFA